MSQKNVSATSPVGPPVYVRRQGRVCTVFLDEGGQPMQITSAEDAPVGGFPFAAPPEAIAARYPGRQLIWIDPIREPQPVSKPLTNAQEAEVARLLGAQGKTQATIQTAPPPPEPRLETLAAQTAVVDDLKRHVLSEFERWTRRALAEQVPQDAEAVGSFLLEAFPELEEGLRAAAEAAKSARPKRGFKL